MNSKITLLRCSAICFVATTSIYDKFPHICVIASLSCAYSSPICCRLHALRYVRSFFALFLEFCVQLSTFCCASASSFFDQVSSLCDQVSTFGDQVSTFSDQVSTLCDQVLTLCDQVSTFCYQVSAFCDPAS